MKKEVTHVLVDAQASPSLPYASLKSESGEHRWDHRDFVTVIYVWQDGLHLAKASNATQDTEPPHCPTLTQPKHLPIKSSPHIYAAEHHLTLLNAIIYLPLSGKWKMSIKRHKMGIPLCGAYAAQSTNKLYITHGI